MKQNFLICLALLFLIGGMTVPASSSAEVNKSNTKVYSVNYSANSILYSSVYSSIEGPRRKTFKSKRKRTIRVKGYHKKNGKYVHPYKKKVK